MFVRSSPFHHKIIGNERFGSSWKRALIIISSCRKKMHELVIKICCYSFILDWFQVIVSTHLEGDKVEWVARMSYWWSSYRLNKRLCPQDFRWNSKIVSNCVLYLARCLRTSVCIFPYLINWSRCKMFENFAIFTVTTLQVFFIYSSTNEAIQTKSQR